MYLLPEAPKRPSLRYRYIVDVPEAQPVLVVTDQIFWNVLITFKCRLFPPNKSLSKLFTVFIVLSLRS